MVKNILVFSLTAMLCLLLLGACVENEPGGTGAASAETSEQPAPAVSNAVSEPAGAETPAATGSESQTGATTEPIIIAESSNTISDAEKQEVLDSLMDEIDSVLGSIDGLEDLDDSDLGTDDIG